MKPAPPIDCGRCGRRLGKRAPHYLLGDGRVVCGRCLANLGYPHAASCTRAAAADPTRTVARAVTGYGDAAPLYLAAGWSAPLPLPRAPRSRFRSDSPAATGRDRHPPSSNAGESNTPTATSPYVSAPNSSASTSTCTKHPDARDRLEQLLGGPLPPTWCSTSRDDGSGIYLYWVPNCRRPNRGTKPRYPAAKSFNVTTATSCAGRRSTPKAAPTAGSTTTASTPTVSPNRTKTRRSSTASSR